MTKIKLEDIPDRLKEIEEEIKPLWVTSDKIDKKINALIREKEKLINIQSKEAVSSLPNYKKWINFYKNEIE